MPYHTGKGSQFNGNEKEEEKNQKDEKKKALDGFSKIY